MSIADRMAILEAGAIRQIGSPTDAYDHPASDYVARLLGAPAMNLLQGRAVDGAFQLADGAISLPLSNVPEGTVTVGIRPENLSLAPSAAGAGATVFEVEPLGGFTVVTLSAGTDQMRALLRGQPRVDADSRVALAVDPATVHFFAADGRALSAARV